MISNTKVTDMIGRYGYFLKNIESVKKTALICVDCLIDKHTDILLPGYSTINLELRIPSNPERKTKIKIENNNRCAFYYYISALMVIQAVPIVSKRKEESKERPIIDWCSVKIDWSNITTNWNSI